MKKIKEYTALFLLLTVVTGMTARAWTAAAEATTRTKCSERLSHLLESSGGGEPLKVWIYFRDRGPRTSVAAPSISGKALDRRLLVAIRNTSPLHRRYSSSRAASDPSRNSTARRRWSVSTDASRFTASTSRRCSPLRSRVEHIAGGTRPRGCAGASASVVTRRP